MNRIVVTFPNGRTSTVEGTVWEHLVYPTRTTVPRDDGPDLVFPIGRQEPTFCRVRIAAATAP